MNDVIVAYGTETGNSEGLAERLQQQLQGSGHGVRLLELDDVQLPSIPQAKAFLVITSTYGEGDPPGNAELFYDALMAGGVPLGGVAFSVCALGDSDYEHYCKCGRDIDAQLEALGGRRIAQRVECDAGDESPYDGWVAQLMPQLAQLASAQAPAQASPAQAPAQPAPPQQLTPQPPAPMYAQPGASSPAYPQEGATRMANVGGSAPATPARSSGGPLLGSKKKPLFAQIIDNHNLNHPQSEKETRHVAISLQGSEVEYQVGDALGVYPRNDSNLVLELIGLLRLNREEKVELDGELMSLFYALKYRKDIVKIDPRLLEHVNPSYAPPQLSAALNNPSARKGYMDEHHVIDVVGQAQLQLTATQLIACLRSLAPRLYSISSSPKAHPGEVHLTVDVLRYALHNTQRKGVASNFLAEHEVGSHVAVYVQPTKEFLLCDASAPIIMVGPGTGIAPFRAMLEEREMTNAPGQSWLFFGSQRSSTDFLYQDQLNAWVRSGRLSQLDCAWSRDQDYKVYVQDLMDRHAQGIWQWLEAGAYVYVCGDAKRMAKDVHSTLLRIISEQGRMSQQDAEEYMKRFKSAKRYRRDIY